MMQRARPLLGTLVEMRTEGLPEAQAQRAIDSAFAEVAEIHRLMSFHEADSDLARVHRARVGERIGVDARTRDVLACALRMAEASAGVFDPTVAAEQVARGYLPRPDSPFQPDPKASWRDIELHDDALVLHKPLWIDLGGIAKGYAVDRATEILIGAGATQACVNAGGDLRVAGSRAECVHVRDAHGRVEAVVELADAAIASSCSSMTGHAAAHLHGVNRRAIGGGITVSVVALDCMVADALTKIVLACGRACAGLFEEFGADACLHDGRQGWHRVGIAA
jgi:thiamine biosynthesis lipoprotein